MSLDIDNLDLMSRIDVSNMIGALEHSAEPFLRPSVEMGLTLGRRANSFHNLVMMGMGGSASAGDVVLDWMRDQLKVPAIVLRDPILPQFVNSNTLFVAISYSGETSETLSAFRTARRRRCHLVGIGVGGTLSKLCNQFNSPFIEVKSTVAPRAALGQLVVAAACTLEGSRLIGKVAREIAQTGRELAYYGNLFRKEVSIEKNPAKRLATRLEGHLVALYCLQRMSSVARRFKNQLAENSKLVAKYDVLPEACHNEIESWQKPSKNMLPVLIRDRNESAFEKRAMLAFRRTVSSAVRSRPLEVSLLAGSRLSRLMVPILFLDYVSVYLALLRRVDPTQTKQIIRYKNSMI